MISPVVYDLETYNGVFTCCAVSLDHDDIYVWEVSHRKNEWPSLYEWLRHLAAHRVEMIGFNNVGFDYPVLHELMHRPDTDIAALAYDKAQRIINGPKDQRFANMVWPSDRLIPQIDLLKIHHFDNQARQAEAKGSEGDYSLSLKSLQFNMRSESVEDLPFPFDAILEPEQIDTLIEYNKHDVLETRKFARHSSDAIAFRRDLIATGQVGGDVLNFSDGKIGMQTLVERLGNDVCYDRSSGRREPRQTRRDKIALGDVIFPYIQFERPEFQRILDWFRSQTITETKGVFKDVNTTLDGFQFVFGTGGLHGSVERRAFVEDTHHAIIDVDVASLYPSIAIENELYPAHLGKLFTREYAGIRTERMKHPKKTAPNEMYKLALNKVYGDSNSAYSPFYDPQYTMATTINGQLMLCMLSERVMAIPGCEMIQANTDGITVRLPRAAEDQFFKVCRDWEAVTRLKLEDARYSRMWVRDVNNYLAEFSDSGALKRIGAYAVETAMENPATRELQWWKNHSNLVVPKAAEAAMVHGIDPADFIAAHADPFDFMIRQRTKGKDQTFIGDEPVQKTLRYYIATDGQPLKIIRPPVAGKRLGDYCKKQGVSDADYNRFNVTGEWDERIHTENRSIYKERKTEKHQGWTVAQCNVAASFDWSRLDRSWYVEEARKLVIT